jgi:hypothetical protein
VTHSKPIKYKQAIPYATTEISGYSFLESSSDFYRAIDELIEHAEDKATAVDSYLDKQ